MITKNPKKKILVFLIFLTQTTTLLPPLFPHHIDNQPTDELIRPSEWNEQLIPLVIVSSLSGNQIEGKTDENYPDPLCKSSDWSKVWVNEIQFGLRPSCLMYNLRLSYDPITQKYSDMPGLTTRIPHYGETRGVRWLDRFGFANIWGEVMDNLEPFGYKDNITLRAHTYDWRKGPNSHSNEHAQLAHLIEETYRNNNNTRVALASLSMGGAYTVTFLNRAVSQEWKDKYIHSFTSIGGVFGGSTWALSTFVTDAGAYSMSGVDFKKTVSSWGSMAWLLPSPLVFPAKAIITTPNANYTGRDMSHVLKIGGFQSMATMYRDVAPYQHFKAPNVKMTCIYGVGTPTQATIDMPEGLQNSAKYSFTEEDGDGTVLTPSLDVCRQWKDQQSQPLEVQTFSGMKHAEGVRDPRFVSSLMRNLGLPVKQQAFWM